MLIFGAPSRYYQGPGCLFKLGEIAAAIGARAAVIVDAVVLPAIETRLRDSFAGVDVRVQYIPFSGNVTITGINELISTIDTGALAGNPDIIVAIGGGKAIDIGKAVSHRLSCGVITVPTAAANDAPTSKNYVIYDDDMVLVQVAHLAESPKAVVVDTSIIAGAPKALLVAGIGDAITKAFEAQQCYASGGINMFGHASSLAAVALANACYGTLLDHAIDGLSIAGTGQSTPEFEKLLEAMFLMGGLGFESGGLSIAHAMTRGLSRIPQAAHAMHGHQVAYGLLVQLVLEGRSPAFLEGINEFYQQVGLARSLADLGVKALSDAIYETIAGPTLAAPHARNFQTTLSEADLIRAMHIVEDIRASSKN